MTFASFRGRPLTVFHLCLRCLLVESMSTLFKQILFLAFMLRVGMSF